MSLLEPRTWPLSALLAVTFTLIVGLVVLVTVLHRYARKMGAPVDYPQVTFKQYKARWMKNGQYLLVVAAVAVPSTVAYQIVLTEMDWNRPTVFFVSWGLMLVVGGIGLAYEDKFLWRGRFKLPAGQDRMVSRVSGQSGQLIDIAPPPITIGLVVALLSYMQYG